MKINDTVHVFHYPTNKLIRTGKLESIKQRYGSIDYVVDGESFNTSIYDHEGGNVVISNELYQEGLRTGFRRYTDYIGVKVKFMVAQLPNEDCDVALAMLEELNEFLTAKANEMGISDDMQKAIRMWNAKSTRPEDAILSGISSNEIRKQAQKAAAEC